MNNPDLGFAPKGLYIGGEWQESADGKSFGTINPSNGTNLGEVPLAGKADVDRAVAAAKKAFAGWSKTPIPERAALLEALADRMRELRDELGMMDCVDAGNSLSGMKGDVDWSADSYRFFAGLIRQVKGETFSERPGHLNLTRRQPYGVVAKINPFNHPFRFCAEKSAAALAAGNTVVLKASEQAPLSSLRFAEICEEILPPGVVNVLTGDAVAGRAMVRHPDVHRIGVVGSVGTGRAVAQDAASDLKFVSLELGGKNPIIIFPDADPIEAATLAIKGMNMNRQGQSCSSTSRVFVHQDLHDEVRDELVRQAEALPVGLPWRDGVELGPIVSEKQHTHVHGLIESGKQQGAALLTGGNAPADGELSNGFFLSPTVFDGVTRDMRIAREEIFGPVMSILTWTDYDEMLTQVNELEYGLTALIVTNDLHTAMETAERVEAGYVWINANGRYLGAPYGGWKYSGLGQEECFEELMSYTRIKNINMRWKPL
jgi:betaine-aldehyde dehydrogenase